MAKKKKKATAKKAAKKGAKKATKKMTKKKMMEKKVSGKKLKTKKAAPKKSQKKATPKKEKTTSLGAATMGGMAGAAAGFGAAHAEESTDFEGMSETMAGDDDMDSVEDEPFTE